MIKDIKARKILDSRGNHTVEVKLETDNGFFVASCPSGASTGKNEAVALPAEKAIENINKIIVPQLLGKDETNQEEVDNLMIELDGTENKSKLGANAILAVSMAICRAGSKTNGLPLYCYISQLSENIQYKGGISHCSCNRRCSPDIDCKLPSPCFNIINGGVHGRNNLEIQEFMIIPQGESFEKNLEIGKVVYKKLKIILKNKFGERGIVIADEGGFSPPIFNDIEALDFVVEAIGDYNVKIGLDCAASQFFFDGKYKIDNKLFDRNGLIEFYGNIVGKYPIISIEDPFAEDDCGGFKLMMKNFGDKIIIVGDDFLTTNIERIKKAKEAGACNGAIIKPNQIGTISETIEAGRLIKSFGWKAVISHRSGETMDDFIADLAVGFGAYFIKSGAPAKKERMVKYNRLVEIDREIQLINKNENY
ncbi:MAG: phosphopyruvate hydratase [Candidatus Nealsonbacteria bacterium RIFCSPLOWO2_12_FULL_39_31]|uniref:Enolase n=3 Tax=Candidatus Nealsoniibacteriota TaxID=1817911 RepID=A0A1G2EH46_9BACT|nr:MAG: Enolase [Parcubacteria group bacterium GW2011_GWA2_38_27]KKQ97822.1 MAG: Enolase [Parcubacteria group bacterium GW2011_GWC2_39_11]OGZ19294.1 MAG: phosphopyruvate hydratase [Candidatus Nealsonbacteria bacterium RIFCSPHIGHO2_01_FULL_38_55]OGZ21806.1 MAG: phosphopyruvate hydratase [Candidatus Nealsonbacteria bacterium RIFCSPHIGHO2_02_FULL_38_75]OGZ22491.1 MAG: phosphopyruvate hydratase [Candidatus Nealsonbacteria bacterium RIFCSPLOWO2_01_FULL_38_120]OGZ23573.1 MAG: phosphopyruvate hydrata